MTARKLAAPTRNEIGSVQLVSRIARCANKDSAMKSYICFFAAGIAALMAQIQPAPAKGCIKGAAVGAVAGHLVAKRGGVGAAAGCAIGHHEANKGAKDQRNGQSSNPSK
jgi:hypothetical protein